MARIFAALIGGMLLGIIAMLAIARFGPASNPSRPDAVIRDIANVPTMTESVATKHREQQFASLNNVEDIVTLPTEFARSEALYALAGRSNSADVQKLIFEANRIADNIERVSLLEILFFRLAETDPKSALALARTAPFNEVRTIEQTVWHAWARKNLDDALFAAKAQTSRVHQNSAAQSLYAAFGYMGHETTARIRAELGIDPDRSTRGRYLYQLADRSPAEAVAFINGLERGTEQQEYVSWLAYYVALQDPDEALRYAKLFSVASDGEHYSHIVNRIKAQENPQAAIDRLLAEGNGGRSSGEFQSAIHALAGTDLDAAKAYFEQARSRDDWRIAGRAIAVEMAKKDAVEALAWARANDKERFPYLEMSVLGQIAQTDPQLALMEAQKTPNAPMRSNLVSNLVQQVAQNNPADAVAYLDQIQDRQQKLQVSQQLASSWIDEDPEAAVAWMLSLDSETAAHTIRVAASVLPDTDLDAAMRMLPKLDGPNRELMRQQVAQKLATRRSPEEAQSFIRQFAGQPGYDQLQASVISGIAHTDVLMAKQLADQLGDGNARDSAYVEVIALRAQTNPGEAARWLSNVSNENVRGAAVAQLAAQWYAQDPTVAVQWLTELPTGPLRDDAIMHMSSQWRDSTAEQENLIASIKDRDKRGQAKVRQIYNVMRTDPAAARQLLEDEDIPSYQRQQVEMMINRYGSRF